MRLFVLGHGPIIDWPADLQMMTPFRLPSRSPGLDGVGEGWIAQVLPFQCSASAVLSLAVGSWFPTAMQLVVDEHDTASSTLRVLPAGFGVVCVTQPVAADAGTVVAAAMVTVAPARTVTASAARRHEPG